MDQLYKCLLFAVLLAFTACEEPAANQNTDPATPNNSLTDTTAATKESVAKPALTRPTCAIKGTVLEENEFWARGENLLVAIVADESTNDPDLGESHRILEVYDGETCERLLRNVLPVNRSPDFPYYLSDITYNNLSQLIAIRGFDKIYIYDLEKQVLSKPMEPAYLNERYAEDAQSGMIQRMELWENYLIGYALSEGAFAFDLNDPVKATPILPNAEFEVGDGMYHSLFFLPSAEKGAQAILPSFDLNTGDFSLNPLFEKPLNVATNIGKSFRNNEYLVIKELLGADKSRPIGVDMRNRRKIDIPNAQATKKDTDIIKWMKTQ